MHPYHPASARSPILSAALSILIGIAEITVLVVIAFMVLHA